MEEKFNKQFLNFFGLCGHVKGWLKGPAIEPIIVINWFSLFITSYSLNEKTGDCEKLITGK